MPFWNRKVRRSASGSFVGFTGFTFSGMRACSGVRPPFFWLQGTQAITMFSQFVMPPSERGFT